MWGANPLITRGPQVILVPCEEYLRCAKVILKIDMFLGYAN